MYEVLVLVTTFVWISTRLADANTVSELPRLKNTEATDPTAVVPEVVADQTFDGNSTGSATMDHGRASVPMGGHMKKGYGLPEKRSSASRDLPGLHPERGSRPFFESELPVLVRRPSAPAIRDIDYGEEIRNPSGALPSLQGISVEQDKGLEISSGYHGLEQKLPDIWTTANFLGFHYPVYEVFDEVQQKNVYYYQPALVIRRDSAEIYAADRQKESLAIRLTVEMWSTEYQAKVTEAVTKATNSTEPPVVRILPIRFIRVSGQGFDGFSVSQKWVSYMGQPPRFTIRFTCETEVICQEVAAQMNDDPDGFLHSHDVKLYLNLDPWNRNVQYEEYLRVAEWMQSAEAAGTGSLTPHRICADSLTLTPTTVTVTTTEVSAKKALQTTTAATDPVFGHPQPFVMYGWTAGCDGLLSHPVDNIQACVKLVQDTNPPQMGYLRSGLCHVTHPYTLCNFYLAAENPIIAYRDRISKAVPNTDVPNFDLLRRGDFAAEHFKAPFPGNATTCLNLCKAYHRCNVAVYSYDSRCYLKSVDQWKPPTTKTTAGSTTFLLDYLALGV